MTNTANNLPSSTDPNGEQGWAAIAHLASLVNLVGIPSPLGPLAVYLLKKKDSEFIATEAKASLNFALSVWIYTAAFLILGALSFLGSLGTGVAFTAVLFIVWGLLILASMIFSIIGGVKALNGEDYEYPFVINLIK